MLIPGHGRCGTIGFTLNRGPEQTEVQTRTRICSFCTARRRTDR
jgi:hypothetical protein